MKTLLALLAAAVLAVGPTAAIEPTKPLVFAAASLKGALDETAAAFKAGTGIEVTISYAGSNTLAKQIAQGAPAEVFISADEDWMNDLASKDLIQAGTRVDLLANELALIAPADSPLELTPAEGFGLAAALGDGKLAMADPDSVPAGKYGKAALTALGVWARSRQRSPAPKMSAPPSALVATGEAPVGIVYVTDARAEPKVKVLGVFPADSHPAILYPAALTTAATPDAARFLAFLREPAATAVFAKAGFGKPAS